MRHSILSLIFYCSIFFVTVSCIFANKNNSIGLDEKNNYLEKLIGLWNVDEENNKYYIIISKDSLVKMYSHRSPASMLLKIIDLDETNLTMVELTDEQPNNSNNKTIQIFKERKYLADEFPYTYSINNGELKLTHKEKGIITKAKNCKMGVCDLQRDFFKEIFLTIDLVVSNEGVAFSPKISDTKIYLGKPLDMYGGVYGSEEQFWINSNMSDLLGLVMGAIEKRDSFGVSHRIVFFIDKNANMEKFLTACLKLYENDMENIFVATCVNHDISQPLEIVLTKIKKEWLNENEVESLSFGEWLKNK